MFGLVGRSASGRRSKWLVLAVWALLAIGFGSLQANLDEVVTDDDVEALPEDSQSRQVSDLLQNEFQPGAPALRNAIVVYQRPDGRLTAADRRKVLADGERFAAVEGTAGPPLTPFVEDTFQPLVSEDGRSAITVVPFDTIDPEELAGPIEEVREISQAGTGGLTVHVTGDAAIESDFDSEFERGESRLLVVTALLVLTLLLFVYRAPAVALVPLFVVGAAYAVAGGVVYLLADGGLNVSDISTALLLVLMFGAGTDYALLLVARYTEQLKHHEDHHDAVAAALPRAGPAMTASGLTVAAALLALTLADLGSTRVLGPVNAIGIVIVLLAGLTLLPAMLAIVGRRGFWPNPGRVAYTPTVAEPALLPGLGPLPRERLGTPPDGGIFGERATIWRRVGERVVRRPGLALVVSILALGAGGIGLTGYESGGDVLSEFRSDTDSTRGYEVVEGSYPAGSIAPFTVMISRTDGGPPADENILAAERKLKALGPDISGIVGPVHGTEPRSNDGTLIAANVAFAGDPYDNAALDRIPEIREAMEEISPGVTGIVGENSATQFDRRETAQRDLTVIVPVVLGVILLILALLLRAVVAPLYLMASVVLSFFGTLGLSLLFFKGVLGEESFDPQLPTFAFMFLVALGVDYNIFLMDRVREESRVHGTREGVLRALAATGPVITSAGIILAGTFAALMTLPITILFELGFVVALGVLIDTFLVRTIVVPAIVRIVGERSWWPSRLGGEPPAQPPTPVAGAPGGPLAQAASGKLPPTPPA